MGTDRIAAFGGTVIAVLVLIVGAFGVALWSRGGPDSACHIPILLSRYRVGSETFHTVQHVEEGPHPTDESRYVLRLPGAAGSIEGVVAGAIGGDGNVTYEDLKPPIDRIDPKDRFVHEDSDTESLLEIRDAEDRLLSGYGCR